MDRDTVAFKRYVSSRYAELVYQGLWYSPLREALDAFMVSVHETTTGEVTVRLYKGMAQPVARTSPHSLYREDLATFDEDAVYDQADAGGFIRLWGLPPSIAARTKAREAEVQNAIDSDGAQIVNAGPVPGLPSDLTSPQRPSTIGQEKV